ncbi:MAG TPA: FHA domain-containing protein [Gemmatimonadales bacterium]|nr:FHA domain-containing protein [Gemmatimonadales bacterium]
MALLELEGRRFPIPAGELLLGGGADCGIVISGPGVLPQHAALRAQADGQIIIRKAVPAADILINGVRLGAEPTPLLHGDKIDIAGHELTFVDERRSGNTQFVQAIKPTAPEAGGARTAPRSNPPPAPAVQVANTGGRVVSLTDGREYIIAGGALVFGRDATCDVVVTGKDVSRRHAEIVQTPRGYLLVDSSTNGTYVNEERIQGQRLLARAEVVRIGDEKFRFYAEFAPAPAAAAPPPAPAAASPAPASSPQRAAPAGALASLLAKTGTLRGQRFPIRSPLANIGRADYNDVVLADPSVSTAHAKLQRREGVWVIVDLDSTNGTFVDGERIKGEAPIGPGMTVRFGDLSLVFEPADDTAGVVKGGGTVVMSTPAVAPKPAPPKAQPAPKPQAQRPKAPVAPASEKKKGKGCGAGVVVLVAAGAGVAALLRWLLA